MAGSAGGALQTGQRIGGAIGTAALPGVFYAVLAANGTGLSRGGELAARRGRRVARGGARRGDRGMAGGQAARRDAVRAAPEHIPDVA